MRFSFENIRNRVFYNEYVHETGQLLRKWAGLKKNDEKRGKSSSQLSSEIMCYSITYRP